MIRKTIIQGALDGKIVVMQNSNPVRWALFIAYLLNNLWKMDNIPNLMIAILGCKMVDIMFVRPCKMIRNINRLATQRNYGQDIGTQRISYH